LNHLTLPVMRIVLPCLLVTGIPAASVNQPRSMALPGASAGPWPPEQKKRPRHAAFPFRRQARPASE
jgi:hypothetical protein